MNLFNNPFALNLTRRHFFRATGFSLGATALASLQAAEAAKGDKTGIDAALPETHFPAKCKHIIYLHCVGGPSQLDLYDYKPKMVDMYDKDLPESIRNGQRLTTMTSGQARFPVAPSKYKFKQQGKCGMWMNDELLVHTKKMADDMVFIRSMNTEAINHEPAITYMQTGNQVHRQAVPRRVDQLRSGQPEPEPTDVRGDGGEAKQSGASAGDLRARCGKPGISPVNTRP